MSKDRSRSITILTGVLFFFFPLLFNPWTLKVFLAAHLEKPLAGFTVMMLWLLAGSSLALGWGVIKFGLCVLREIWVIFLFCLPVFFTVAYLCLFFGKTMNAAKVFHGEMLTIIICSFFVLIFSRRGLLLGFVFMGLVTFIELMYAVTYKTPISPSAFYNIFETNPLEAKGYLAGYLLSLPNLIFIVVTACVCLLIFRVAAKADRKRIKLYFFALSSVLALPLVLPGAYEKVSPNNLLCKIASGYLEYKQLYEKVNEFSNKPLDEIEPVSFSQPKPDDELHVFILGESADRDHMGIYGYGRDNTPKMKEMADELFLFSDVISVHCNTIPNMEKMLTFSNYENDENFFEKGSLIHYLRKAGYETHWISNQNPIGTCDTMTTVLAKTCDSVLFVNHSESSSMPSLDEKILPVFQETISSDASGRKFVFIHLMGSHAPFALRYPRQFDTFEGNIDGKTEKQSKIINQYSNSILYSDHIVTEIIGMVKETNRYASVLYISDHGLDLYDAGNYCGHSIHRGLEMPFVLWVSDEYKSGNSVKVANFNRYLDRKYTSEHIFFSVCDLLNMRFDSFQPNRSIFSESFRMKKRFVGMPNKESIRNYDSKSGRIDKKSKIVFENQPDDFKKKVWAHRVNNGDKLVSAAKIFYGMELDVVFDFREKTFDVRHPPAKTNNLSLDQYWGRLDNAGQFKFWIDFKNMSPENGSASLERLLYLAGKHRIPHENIIIESRVSFPLRDFKTAGFMTSYWVTVSLLQNDGGKRFNELAKNKQLFLKKIKKELEEHGIDAVSFPIEFLDVVNKFLPEVDTVNVWASEMRFDRQDDLAEVARILEANPRINTFLVKYLY